MSPRAAAAATLLLLASRAGAGVPFPARTGESGLLDVPDAEVLGVRGGLLAAELRLDDPGTPDLAYGPFPVYGVAGVLERLDMGFTMRESGFPGDPKPRRLLLGAAAKYQLLSSSRSRPALALDLTIDRINGGPVYGSRFIASTAPAGRLRFSAFVGGELGREPGVTYGGAVAITHRSGAELILEGLSGPRGPDVGAAIRWRALRSMGASVGVNYLPDEDGLHLSVGFSFAPGPRPAAKTAAAAPAAPSAAAPEETVARGPAGDRPRFALRIRAGETGGEPRHVQHGPYVARAGAGLVVPGRAAAPPPRPAQLSTDEILEAQVRDAEAAADARARRLAATNEQLAARLDAAKDDGRRLDARERDLDERARQLDARERRATGAPSAQQRQLASQEAQLAAQERQLAAQERSLAPALEAAQGRENEAAAREDVERQELNRLAASASAARTRAEQLEVRKQVLATRNRQLAALEVRLVAVGERIDVLERQLRARAERLDAAGRRLDARAERLDLLERRASAASGPETAAPVQPEHAAPATPKDKAVFVMVVKSPTTVVKEGAAAPAGAPQPPAETVHPGVAVEKAVAAAAVVSFPTPASRISELDREAIESVARLAARERCELLVWARAKDPAAMAEAQRRAAELRAVVMAAAKLQERQVVTRVTTRPGSVGVDVVVSALRDRPVAGAAPVPAGAPAPAGAAPAAPAQAGATSETTRRLIRSAVLAAQPSIEACLSQQLDSGQLTRADGVLQLRVTVGLDGRPLRVSTAGGDVRGPTLDACLQAASSSWRFPATGAEYDVDVPISLIRRGGVR